MRWLVVFSHLSKPLIPQPLAYANKVELSCNEEFIDTLGIPTIGAKELWS